MTEVDSHLVRIETGLVRGRSRHGVREFRNIPYAAPPVGALRFRRPEPARPWDGELDATADSGPTSPQVFPNFKALDIVDVSTDGWHEGDDYLTLNVWAPEPAGEQPLPVMVWIHGGSFVLGHKDVGAFVGANFARSGVVTVAINYRLGVEGFVAVEGAPTNLGLRDQIAALQWVQRNIAAFGGAPDTVTIFGESAGGMSVGCLIASPLTTGLFARAIAQSGAGAAALPIDLARRTAAGVAKKLKVAADVAGLASRSPADAAQALAKASRPGAVDLRDDSGFNPYYGFMLAGPVYGDDVLPQHPLTLLQRGAGRDIDVMLSTTAEEMNFFFAPTPLRFAPKAVSRWALRHVHPDGNRLYDAYAEQHPQLRPSMVWCSVLTDAVFRWPARQFAEAHQGRSYVYEFDWCSPAAKGRLGAAHGVDIGFTFDALPVITGPRRVGGEAPPQELATHLHQLLVRFAVDGTVAWPQFDRVGRNVYQLATREARPEPVLPAANFLPTLLDLA
jgi:para-nitrobenzyl esterase